MTGVNRLIGVIVAWAIIAYNLSSTSELIAVKPAASEYQESAVE